MSTLSRTLAELTTRIRNRCDQANSDFISDTEIGEMVNASRARLVDEILEVAGPEALLDSFSSSTVAGTSVYAVTGTGGPSSSNDAYRIAGVDVQWSGRWYAIRPWAFSRRTALEGQTGWSGPGDTFYRVRALTQATGATSVEFFPTPAAVVSFRVWYLPIAHEASASVDVGGLNGWEEYIISDVCAMVLEKEESASAPFVARREEARARIRWAAANIDDSGTDRIRATVNWGGIDPLLENEPLV